MTAAPVYYRQLTARAEVSVWDLGTHELSERSVPDARGGAQAARAWRPIRVVKPERDSLSVWALARFTSRGSSVPFARPTRHDTIMPQDTRVTSRVAHEIGLRALGGHAASTTELTSDVNQRFCSQPFR